MDFFKKPKKVKIIDDDGMIAIANVKTYNANLKFQENWTWKQLNDFMLDKNRNSLIVFSTGSEEEWTLEFLLNEESKKPHFRKFEQNIEVTNGNLNVVSWSDLISTLQFTDSELPEDSNKDLKVNVKNGFYRVVVKQLFDHEDYEYNAENKVNFIVELFPQNQGIDDKAECIAWTENFPNDGDIFLTNEPNDFDNFLKELLKSDKQRGNP